MTDTQPRPFDERAALEELERLADRIQSTRRQRERAVTEFNAFVKTFKDEDHAARWKALQASATAQASAVPRAIPVAGAEAVIPPPAPEAAERRSPESPPPAAPAPIAPSALDSEAESMAWSAPPREPQGRPEQSRGAPRRGADIAAFLASPRRRLAAGAAALLAVVLIVSWLWGGSGRGPDATPLGDSPPAAQAPPATAPAAPSQPTPVASTGPRALNVVLMTSRPVWTRVTVDDRKVIEREIPGGQTIPIGADRAIVIRAGDAGAIRVIVDGKDSGVLGRDGQIASRMFSAPVAR